MNTRGARLLELQEIETDLRDKLTRYKRIQRLLNEESPVRKAQLAHTEAEGAEATVRGQQQAIQDEWQKLIQKVDVEEKRLYSGEVGNPKELLDLQLEVEMLKRQREKLEEQALTLIEEVEQKAQQSGETLAQLREVEEESSARLGDLEVEEASLKRYISNRRRQRDKLLALIDPSDLEQYRYVQRLKNDTHAVALLRDGVCMSCHIEVSNSKRESVERAGVDRLITCGNCGRILVH